jgi:hypothetical protein
MLKRNKYGTSDVIVVLFEYLAWLDYTTAESSFSSCILDKLSPGKDQVCLETRSFSP